MKIITAHSRGTKVARDDRMGHQIHLSSRGILKNRGRFSICLNISAIPIFIHGQPKTLRLMSDVKNSIRLTMNIHKDDPGQAKSELLPCYLIVERIY